MLRGDIRVAAIQMVSGPKVSENLSVAASLLAEAAAGGAQWVVLPEYFPLLGASDAERLRVAETPGEGPLQAWLSEQAQMHGFWLFGGSIPLQARDKGKVLNSCLVFDPQGKACARYDKIHLFAFEQGRERYCESDHIEAGPVLPQVLEIERGRVGVSICYDLRFPELYRAMVKSGPPDLLVIPAAFTETTGRAHWEVLLRARAIENQCYVLAAGQGGVHHGGRETHGHSLLIDPWGEVLACQPKGAGVVHGVISADRLQQIREGLPALEHHHLQELLCH